MKRLRRMKVSENNLVKDDKSLALAETAVASMEKGSEVAEVTPIDEVVKSLADFTKDAFAVTMESTRLTRALEESLIDDLKTDKLSSAEKISLYNVERSASNDRLFKLLTPTFQAINEKQRAEIESARRAEQLQSQNSGGTNLQVNVNAGSGVDAKVAEMATPEVKTGLLAMSNLLQAWGAHAQKENEVKED